MSSMTLKRSALAIALAGTFGLGAVAADRVLPPTTAATPAAAAAPATVPVPVQNVPAARALPGFADLVAQQGPAVVQVTSTRAGNKAAALKGRRGMPDIDPDELPPFLRNFPWGQTPNMPSPGPSRGLGSGFIVNPDGLVLTNAHVVADSDEVMVKLVDQREFKAKVLGTDPTTDVAVLKIEAKGLPTVKLGDPAKTRVGDWVVAIGTPYGLDNTVTSGIVSAKSRSLPGDSVVPFIQTDAAVNPGNSGGPLFNMEGEVIGINSQIFSRSGGFQGLAFAIPIDVALKVRDDIVTHGKVSHGRLGVTVQAIDQTLAENFGLKSPQGALVSSVQKNSPAAKAGLEPGDVITKFNGVAINRSSDLPSLVASLRAGSPAKIEIWRDGKTREVTAQLAERETPKNIADAGDDGALPQGKLGLAVRPLTSDEMAEAKVSHGVVVEQVAGAAARAGVQPGDVILSVNRTPVKNPAQLRELVGKSSKTVALLIQRDDAQIFVPVRIG
jgi:serine protease Do